MISTVLLKKIASISLCVGCLIPLFSAETVYQEIQTQPGLLAGSQAHVQGICCDEDAIYLTFKNKIFKIDWNGKLLASTDADNHAGDPCLHNGKLFIAMSEPGGHGVYEYDTDLNLVRKVTLENAAGIDGIAFLNGSFYTGAPSTPDPHRVNHINQYDSNFQLIKEYSVDFGVETNFNAQAIVAYNNSLIVGFYPANGNEIHTVRFSPEMTTIETYKTSVGNGIDLAPKKFQSSEENPRFIVARTTEQNTDRVQAHIRWFELRNGELVDITENAQ